MAAVTICSDFGAPKNKIWHCFHCFPIYFPWSDGTRCRDLSFLNTPFAIHAPVKFKLLSVWTQCSVLPKPCSSACACLFLLQNPVQTQERPWFHCRKREMSADTKVPERIPAKGQSTTSNMSQTQCYLLAWVFSNSLASGKKRKSSSSQMHFLFNFQVGSGYTLNCSLPIFISQSSICGRQMSSHLSCDARGSWGWWRWLGAVPTQCPKAPESGQSEALLLDWVLGKIQCAWLDLKLSAVKSDWVGGELGWSSSFGDPQTQEVYIGPVSGTSSAHALGLSPLSDQEMIGIYGPRVLPLTPTKPSLMPAARRALADVGEIETTVNTPSFHCLLPQLTKTLLHSLSRDCLQKQIKNPRWLCGLKRFQRSGFRSSSKTFTLCWWDKAFCQQAWACLGLGAGEEGGQHCHFNCIGINIWYSIN